MIPISQQVQICDAARCLHCPRVDPRTLGSLSNRVILVSNLIWCAIWLALYAGIRVVSAVGMKPPHDGRSRVRPPRASRGPDRPQRTYGNGLAHVPAGTRLPLFALPPRHTLIVSSRSPWWFCRGLLFQQPSVLTRYRALRSALQRPW